MNNTKYHYIAVTELSDLLVRYLSRFSNFQTDEKFKQHRKSCKNHNHIELEIFK